MSIETNKWKCPRCGSSQVEISLPAWHIERADHSIEYVETDCEADIQYWACGDCSSSGQGMPALADEEVPRAVGD